jgi:hypothetical protein
LDRLILLLSVVEDQAIMFFNFTFPKNLLSSPIVQSELTYLRQLGKVRSGWLQHLNNALKLLACVVATLPLWLYMDDQIRTYVLIFFMGLTIYLVHLQAVTRTLTLASQAIARETESGNWDSLVMTGLDARQIIMSKWWAVMRCVWKDHLFAAILKFGLVLALGQYFNVVYLGACYRHLGGGLCYVSDGYYYPYSSFPIFATLSMLCPVAILIAFGLLEGALLAAIGIYTSMFSKYRVVGMAWAVAIRGLLIAIAIVSFFLIASRSQKIFEQNNFYAIRWFMSYQERQNILGTLQLSLSTFADSGTIMTTDLIRRTWNYDYWFGRFASAIILLGVFAALTRFVLKLAQHSAVKNHALRPPG